MRGLAAALFAAAAAMAHGQSFTVHRTLYNVGPNPSAIVAADLNGDGVPDIATADTGRLRSPRDERPANNEVSVLMSSAALAYTPIEPLSVGFAPYALALANMDARKALDIVVGSFMDNRQHEAQRDITLFRNLGENLFERHDFAVPDDRIGYRRAIDADGLPTFETPGITSVAVADFNEDGLRDVIAAAWSSDAIVFFAGHAETQLAAPVWIDLPGGPRDLAIADYTGDGHIDIAVTLYQTDRVAVLVGDGLGAFAMSHWFPARGRLPHSIRAADFNGDGAMDLAVSNCDTDDSVVVFVNDGKGRFPLSSEILLGPDRDSLEAEIRDIQAGDVNGDGRTDLVAACFASGQVAVLINEASGDGGVRFNRTNYRFDEGRPRAVCLADFNSDGKPDIAAALWERNAVGLLLAR